MRGTGPDGNDEFAEALRSGESMEGIGVPFMIDDIVLRRHCLGVFSPGEESSLR